MSHQTCAAGLHTADGRQPRVAVVTDNATDAIVASILVEQFGCAVVTAFPGANAVSLLLQRMPIDLVLVDLADPAINHIAAGQVLRKLGNRAHPPIIPIDAYSDRPSLKDRDTAGFADSLTKPYSPRQLFSVLNAVLARGSISAAFQPEAG